MVVSAQEMSRQMANSVSVPESNSVAGSALQPVAEPATVDVAPHSPTDVTAPKVVSRQVFSDFASL
jgi:hypothetical protein